MRTCPSSCQKPFLLCFWFNLHFAFIIRTTCSHFTQAVHSRWIKNMLLLQTCETHCSSSPDTLRGGIIIYDGWVIDEQEVVYRMRTRQTGWIREDDSTALWSCGGLTQFACTAGYYDSHCDSLTQSALEYFCHMLNKDHMQRCEKWFLLSW